jgi:hypothetical protein
MKRGLIQWDRETLPPAVFEERLAKARAALEERDLAALAVYSDVWRSNHARYLTNFMPYWNRSLAVIPRQGAPVLLCGLSPRVYPWIRSVTVFEEIRPAPRMMEALEALCAEREWTRIGAVSRAQWIQEFEGAPRAGSVELVDVASADVLGDLVDDAELQMRRRAARLARETLEEHLWAGSGHRDCELAGRLERELRLRGAEDVAILISTGETVPAPARGALLRKEYSVCLAVELAGHWAKVTRPNTARTWWKPFPASALSEARGANVRVWYEDLSGPHPWQLKTALDFPTSRVHAIHIELVLEGQRWFYGDTCQGSGVL